MLDFYHRLALRLQPLRALFWVLGAAALVVFKLSLFGPDDWRHESYSVASMALLMWMVLGGGIVYGFRTPLPEADPEAGRGRRLLAGIQRGFLGLFGLFLSVLGVLVLFATARSAGMFLQAMS